MPGDGEVLAAARADEEWAWVALIERYDALVSSVAWSFRLGHADVAEIRQVVWLRLFENIHTIREPERVAGWIKTVTSRECQCLQAKYRREAPGSDADIVCRQAEDASDDEVDWPFVGGECQAAIGRALVGLSGKGRLLVEALLEQPGISYGKLAIKLDMPIGSIGPTRQRCFRKLRGHPELANLAPQ